LISPATNANQLRRCTDPASGELLSTTGRGLSCATFVLAVFASLGIDILDLKTWKVREDDSVWQKQIVDIGRKMRPTAEDHWDYLITKELGCIRYRPQEVAVGATADEFPACFEDVIAPAERLAERLPAPIDT
jgi:hypothetical protein